MMPARVRFAPSPTGRFHIGGARTALYNFLIARQTGGQFILRIEDTDIKRLVPSAEQEIMDSLRWLGMEWDEGPTKGGPFGPYRQSERASLYQQHALELIDRGSAYYCFCPPQRLAQVRQQQEKRKQPPRYDGLCRDLPESEANQRVKDGEKHVVRFKIPRDGSTTAVDLPRGPITVDNSSLDDYILLKSDGLPVYHLAAIVDDHLMQITHVLRGSEWLPTFPLHVLIYQAFNWPQPIWVHLSLFLNPSGKGKLSKRQAADPQSGIKAVFALDLKQLGYLPEAVVNWMALMGWSYDDHTELFSMAELIRRFTLERLNPSPAAVDFSKLDHFNGLYIRNLNLDDLSGRLEPVFRGAGLDVDRDLLQRVTPLVRERIRTLDEVVDMAGFFFRDRVEPQTTELVGEGMTSAETARAAERAGELIASSSSMDPVTLEPALRALADELGLSARQLFGILRTAVTGQRVSPPLIESMHLIGRNKVVERIRHAVELLQRQPM